jgi:DNA polymerase-3 subunit epsilon
VPNCKLGTLAERFRLGHTPTHRALDDALATGDLLHVLLERAGSLGVLGLDDLLSLPTITGHPQIQKLRLTDDLPRAPGVYLFRDVRGRVLYVGKATNLRTRVRSYFSGDERRKIGQLLRETHTIDHVVAPGPLEAAVLEVRLIHEHLPRFNRQAKTWRRYAYLKLTLQERFPRLSVVKAPKDDGALYLGPVSTSATAQRIAEAIQSAMPLRRCTKVPPRTPLPAPCAPAQLGVSLCPCAAAVTEEEYAAVVAAVVRGLTADPTALLAPLEARMLALAGDERFEEAADVRDRASALAAAIRRQRRLDAVRRAGRILVEVPGRGGVELDGGVLVRSWQGDQPPLTLDKAPSIDADPRAPLPRHLADEVAVVAAWLEHEASRVRLVSCTDGFTSPTGRIPRFEPVAGNGSERTATKVLLRAVPAT